MNHKFDFKTSYNTFFLTSDNGATIILNWAQDEDSGYSDRLIQAENLLAIRTESYGHIKGELIVSKTENKQIDYNKYDHIVEGGLDITSGNLEILDCPNTKVELELKVNPGKYRVRVYSSNLASADIDEDEGDDYYKIEIWPDSNMERKVLKQYMPKK